MNLPWLVIMFCCWEALDVALQMLLRVYCESAHFKRICPDSKNRGVVRAAGPAYAKSTLHAVIVAARGWKHLYMLWGAPMVAQLQLLPAGHAAYSGRPALLPESVDALRTNILLAAYLLSDLLHVLADYPRLGGADTVAHHAAFFGCALVAGSHRMVPFMFAWLIIGECSTPFLNARWAFIKTGNGAHWLFKHIERSFVFWFVLTRLFIYGAGLSYQVYILWIGTPILGPLWAMTAVMGFVVTGFALNMVWLRKIAGVLAKSRTRDHSEKEAEQTEGNSEIDRPANGTKVR